MNIAHRERIHPTVFTDFEGEILYEGDSEFQHIKMLKNPQYGHILVLDEVLQTTENDEFIYHEAAVHVPACALEQVPKRALIIGGGDGGALNQALKIPSIEEIVMVELDPAVVEVSKKYFPFWKNFDSEKIRIVFADGAEFVKRVEEKAKFDFAIIDSSDIQTPAKVLYTEEFYADLKTCLTSGGIILHQTGLPEQADLASRVSYRAIGKVFPHVAFMITPVMTYGECIAFVVGSDKDVSVPKREFVGKWYNPALHTAYFAIPTYWNEWLKNG